VCAEDRCATAKLPRSGFKLALRQGEAAERKAQGTFPDYFPVMQNEFPITRQKIPGYRAH
jgi:hypothetical protein